LRNQEKDELEMAARRDAMLREGFRLFAEKGIGPVSMQEVANACGVGIATLYRYYNTKLALVIAIGTQQWEEYRTYARGRREACGADAMCAAEELDFYLDFYIDLYQNYKDLLRFNQDFNNFVQHEGATEEQLRPYVEVVSEFNHIFRGVYEKGLHDGSIRTDMPPDKMFAATSHIMLAVAVRYAQGLLYSADREEDRTEEFLLLKQMILNTFTR